MLADSFITRAEFCKKLGVHPDTARRWERQGRIPSFAITGNCVRYRLSDVQRLLRDALASNRKRPGPKPRKGALPLPTAVPAQKPANAIPAPQEKKPVTDFVASLVDLGFAQGCRVLLCRTVVEMRLFELNKALPCAEALSVFLDNARKAVVELIREGDTVEAAGLLSELAKIARPDGVLLSVDPTARPVLDELRASIPLAVT